jgi:hypothetical protein
MRNIIVILVVLSLKGGANELNVREKKNRC